MMHRQLKTRLQSEQKEQPKQSNNLNQNRINSIGLVCFGLIFLLAGLWPIFSACDAATTTTTRPATMVMKSNNNHLNLYHRQSPSVNKTKILTVVDGQEPTSRHQSRLSDHGGFGRQSSSSSSSLPPSSKSSLSVSSNSHHHQRTLMDTSPLLLSSSSGSSKITKRSINGKSLNNNNQNQHLMQPFELCQKLLSDRSGLFDDGDSTSSDQLISKMLKTIDSIRYSIDNPVSFDVSSDDDSGDGLDQDIDDDHNRKQEENRQSPTILNMRMAQVDQPKWFNTEKNSREYDLKSLDDDDDEVQKRKVLTLDLLRQCLALRSKTNLRKKSEAEMERVTNDQFETSRLNKKSLDDEMLIGSFIEKPMARHEDFYDDNEGLMKKLDYLFGHEGIRFKKNNNKVLLGNHRVIDWKERSLKPIFFDVGGQLSSKPKQQTFFEKQKTSNSKNDLIHDHRLRRGSDRLGQQEQTQQTIIPSSSSLSSKSSSSLLTLSSLYDRSKKLRFKKDPFDKQGIRFKRNVQPYQKISHRYKKSPFDDEGIRYRRSPLIQSLFEQSHEGLRFKKSPFDDDEGIRYKKTPFDSEGIRYKKSPFDDDEGIRYKKTPFDSEGIRYKKSPMFENEGIRYKKTPLFDGEGIRYKKSPFDSEGIRFKKSL